jgi:hypothetical protein
VVTSTASLSEKQMNGVKNLTAGTPPVKAAKGNK